MNIISRYCAITEDAFFYNGKSAFPNKNNDNFAGFIKKIYRNYRIGYPKFFKMDKLCKLGFLTSELLLMGLDLKNKYDNEDTGIILQNGSSTIDIDNKFQKTINDRSNYYPSPSLFVYTLPNIMTGEICIKNKIKGENTVFISEKFDPEFSYSYINSLLGQDKLKRCIGGWVEYKNTETWESFMFLAQKKNITNSDNQNPIELSKENIDKLYNNLKK